MGLRGFSCALHSFPLAAFEKRLESPALTVDLPASVRSGTLSPHPLGSPLQGHIVAGIDFVQAMTDSNNVICIFPGGALPAQQAR